MNQVNRVVIYQVKAPKGQEEKVRSYLALGYRIVEQVELKYSSEGTFTKYVLERGPMGIPGDPAC